MSLLAFAALIGSLGPASAASPIPPETVGRWRFQRPDRPVKAVVLGGSVSAWPRGGFGQFLQAACSRVEVVNRGKARIGARQLKERFVKQVLRNRRLDLDALTAGEGEVWLLFQGGLNSVGTPARTNRKIAEIFAKAHGAGLQVAALSLGPWGSDRDTRRWRLAKGLSYFAKTKLTVDFLMGRVGPDQAFGGAPGTRPEGYLPGERPDVAVDLFDSPLRDREAPLREHPRLDRLVERDAWVRRQLKALEGDGARATFLAEQKVLARELPRWFMRPGLQGFDAIHPNAEGHRVIAQTACPSLPASWSCDCASLERMRWSHAERRVIELLGSAGAEAPAPRR